LNYFISDFPLSSNLDCCKAVCITSLCSNLVYGKGIEYHFSQELYWQSISGENGIWHSMIMMIDSKKKVKNDVDGERVILWSVHRIGILEVNIR